MATSMPFLGGVAAKLRGIGGWGGGFMKPQTPETGLPGGVVKQMPGQGGMTLPWGRLKRAFPRPGDPTKGGPGGVVPPMNIDPSMGHEPGGFVGPGRIGIPEVGMPGGNMFPRNGGFMPPFRRPIPPTMPPPQGGVERIDGGGNAGIQIQPPTGVAPVGRPAPRAARFPGRW